MDRIGPPKMGDKAQGAEPRRRTPARPQPVVPVLAAVGALLALAVGMAQRDAARSLDNTVRELSAVEPVGVQPGEEDLEEEDIIEDIEAHKHEVQEGADSAHEGHGTDEVHHGPHGYMALFFLFGGFALGCVLQVCQERYLMSIPYTALLFVVGFALAIIHHFRPHKHWSYWPSWYQSVEMWQHVDPHLVMYVFLPALIFAEAMKLNIKLGKRLLGQVLLLACPGVIIGTLLTAVFSKFVFPYNWSWATAFVFGSILAATDPVAVVALFNTLGVSPRLTMLISGESLLNDGTAIVLFKMTKTVWSGESLSPQGVIIFFLQMTVVSVFLGIAMGALALIVIFGSAETRYHSDAMIQVAVTVCCGFLCFFLAENEIETSGVLAVVSAGCMFSYLAWPRFVSRETMHTVWEFIEFMGNTVIFLLAGLLFGQRVLTRQARQHLEWSDCILLVVLYFAATLIRLFMITVLWPLLNCCGERVSWQEVVVMTWSGLRGAVGLILAMDVDLSTSMNSKVGSRIMFHVGGMAMLTILVNATLCAPLLRKLGITKTEDIEEKCIAHFEQMTDWHAHSALRQIMESGDPDPRFVGASMEMATGLVPVLASDHKQEHSSSRVFYQSQQALMRSYREIFMRAVQHHYWMDIEGGLIPRTARVSRILLYSADCQLDSPDKRLKDWDTIEETLDEHQAKPCLSKICLIWPLSSIHILAELVPSPSTIMMWQVYAALAFIEAHKAARAEVQQQFCTEEIFGLQVKMAVAEESKAQCARAHSALAHLPLDAVEAGKSRMLAGRLLNLQVQKVTELKEMGILSQTGAGHILHRLQDAQRHVATREFRLEEDALCAVCEGDSSGEDEDSELLSEPTGRT